MIPQHQRCCKPCCAWLFRRPTLTLNRETSTQPIIHYANNADMRKPQPMQS
ncbi:hypothetical protein M3J09_004686 [Ascochyta lentis]